MVYVLYLVLLAGYSFVVNEGWFMVFPFVVSTVLFAYEGLQMYNSGFDYWHDPWNYLDLTRGALFNTFCILTWLGYTDEATTEVFTLTVLISWIRGITYFKMFERTRYLIKLIMEASIDIVAFFVLLFYSTFAFGMVMQTFELNQESLQSLDNYFVSSYKQNLGELPENPNDLLRWFLFIIISIVNPVIMLNLLISIMGDTYGRVKAGKVVADARELAGMILEVELLMGWNRNKKFYAFVKIACEENFLDIDDSSVDFKVMDLKGKIEALANVVFQAKKNILDALNSSKTKILRAKIEKD